MLEWVFRRCDGAAGGTETAIGTLPVASDLNIEGLDIDAADLSELLKVDPAEWKAELPSIEDHLDNLGERLPDEMRSQLAALSERLG